MSQQKLAPRRYIPTPEELLEMEQWSVIADLARVAFKLNEQEREDFISEVSKTLLQIINEQKGSNHANG